MTTVNECESVSTKYYGNSTQKLFQFSFTYMSYNDIVCFILNDEGSWINQDGKFIFANATTVEFLTPPPAPQDSTVKNVWITRRTDLESMLATFYPGSAIRAQDLNDDFDQLRLAIQEGRCSLEDFKEQLGSIARPIFDRADQEAGKWSGTGDQDYLATSGAIAAREDTIVGENLPPTVTFQQPGKGWENTDECWSSYWNPDANAWVAYVNTGPRGVPGQDGADGQSIQGPPGAEGPPGPPGTGINVTGYIDVPGPPSFNGTAEGDYVIDSNGVGWFWETDTDPASWVDTGTIRGPQGEPGTPGAPGAAGTAATIAVGNTITGNPGTNAAVVNTGTNSAAVFQFTIPRGEKGEPGQNGTGSGTLTEIVVSNPITVANPQGPVVTLGFDMSLLATLP